MYEREAGEARQTSLVVCSKVGRYAMTMMNKKKKVVTEEKSNGWRRWNVETGTLKLRYRQVRYSTGRVGRWEER